MEADPRGVSVQVVEGARLEGGCHWVDSDSDFQAVAAFDLDCGQLIHSYLSPPKPAAPPLQSQPSVLACLYASNSRENDDPLDAAEC